MESTFALFPADSPTWDSEYFNFNMTRHMNIQKATGSIIKPLEMVPDEKLVSIYL